MGFLPRYLYLGGIDSSSQNFRALRGCLTATSYTVLSIRISLVKCDTWASKIHVVIQSGSQSLTLTHHHGLRTDLSTGVISLFREWCLCAEPAPHLAICFSEVIYEESLRRLRGGPNVVEFDFAQKCDVLRAQEKFRLGVSRNSWTKQVKMKSSVVTGRSSTGNYGFRSFCSTTRFRISSTRTPSRRTKFIRIFTRIRWLCCARIVCAIHHIPFSTFKKNSIQCRRQSRVSRAKDRIAEIARDHIVIFLLRCLQDEMSKFCEPIASANTKETRFNQDFIKRIDHMEGDQGSDSACSSQNNWGKLAGENTAQWLEVLLARSVYKSRFLVEYHR